MNIKTLFSIAALAMLSNQALAQDDAADDEWDMDEWQEEEVKPYRFSGFLEAAYGTRLSSDPAIERNKTLTDVRGQLSYDYDFSASRFSLTVDAYYDGVREQLRAQLREAAWQGSLANLGDWGKHFDLKIGQQVLTWGTGDYVFLNDLFPKDYQSFFSGRDDEYLKAPSLSVRLSGFFELANIDVAITPEFTSDNYINGDYFSFFSPMARQNVAPGFEVPSSLEPDSPEVAVRAYKTIGQTEYAVYAYDGYHKSPNSFTINGIPYFAELAVYGASAITPMGSGLFNAEFAYYDSKDDAEGNNPLIANSQTRWLVGYEQELIKNLTGSVQWYMERTLDHDQLILNSPTPEYEPNRSRVVLTQRLSYRALQQTLTFSLFNFYSTSDSDGYAKMSVDYSPGDKWRLSGGLNLFYGNEPQSFFNQFADASNAFVRYRYYY
ncbi:hypothetical protein [Alteromonas facilis]|uniref:hypothetical protein n=1 Tax=Alteromonas facilis TaxID=2048004 RepID=UPI000C28D290|nr:hypothetical protein [Alteromonas facilis]